MTVQEVFNSPAVKAVEIAILDIIKEEDNTWKNPRGKVAVEHLLYILVKYPFRWFRFVLQVL